MVLTSKKGVHLLSQSSHQGWHWYLEIQKLDFCLVVVIAAGFSFPFENTNTFYQVVKNVFPKILLCIISLYCIVSNYE